MTVLSIMLPAVVILICGGWLYSRFIARSIGEEPDRPGPAIAKADGRDYIPTPTGIVFAHHFASIAGAGPIIGPVLGITYGWLPALLWVVLGGIFIGATHDYLATHMATREGGQSIAVIVRRAIGTHAFIAMAILLILMLALVCAAFLNASATALTSTLPFERIELPEDQTLFSVASNAETGRPDKVIIGGIASMSVVVITAIAPLLGWLYIKKKTPVWLCSLLAIGICAVSVYIGIRFPIHFPEIVRLGGMELTGQRIWVLILSAYVLVAAGVPVWIFLQSRDFINVHILYVGMGLLLVTLAKAGIAGAPLEMPMLNIQEGTEATGLPIWPGLFIIIACGAVSGFHSLCAGGTTCKQIKTEGAARRIGYFGMLLESFLAVCVISVIVLGTSKLDYFTDVYPKMAGLAAKGNPILGFAMAVGNAVKIAWGLPIAVGALAGMILLEGFLVTTLDTAIRLTRYLIEEVWRSLFSGYDILQNPIPDSQSHPQFIGGEAPVGTDGIPISIEDQSYPSTPTEAKRATGPIGWLLVVLSQYWVNSAIAVALMLAFAFSGGLKLLWPIFATSNQLLAAIVLALASLWLLKKAKRFWFALIPAVAMFATTAASLVLLYRKFSAPGPQQSTPLLAADLILMIIPVYLLVCGLWEIVRYYKGRRAEDQPTDTPQPGE